MTKKKWILLILAIVIMNIVFKIHSEMSKEYVRNREESRQSVIEP